MRDLLRRFRGSPRQPTTTQPLSLTFGEWEALTGTVLAVCHPDWRGVRTAAHAFRDPLAMSSDVGLHTAEIVEQATTAGVSTLVVHGFPPGTAILLAAARQAGLTTRVTVHSSMAQHGAEAGEAQYMDAIAELAAHGAIARIGFVKAGVAEVFAALGLPAVHTPNRSPMIPDLATFETGPHGPHIGVFGANYWRKNVVTQLGAVALIAGTAHVMVAPPVAYLRRMAIHQHGELERDAFLAVQAAMDLNLYVSLSECHPMGPMESFLTGVPALMSRTSDLFADDPDLWDLVTVDTADNPARIAAAAHRLLEHGPDAVARARTWLDAADRAAARRWADFVS